MNNDNLLPIVTKLLSSEDMTVKAAVEVLNYIPSNELDKMDELVTDEMVHKAENVLRLWGVTDGSRFNLAYATDTANSLD